MKKAVELAGGELRADGLGAADGHGGQLQAAAAGQRQAFVDLFDPNEPTGRRRVPVKVGISNGTRAQLLQGVKKGDKVILPS